MTSQNANNCPIKLHIGCGTKYFDGWINIDNNSDNNITKLDLNLDLRNPMPFRDGSVDYVYCEHFLEHLTPQEGVFVLNEVRRVLKPDGVFRVAMPALEDLIKFYNNENWKQDNAHTFKEFGLGFVQTRAEYLNMNFRWWGHQWLYDWEELERRLHEAGFAFIQECEFGISSYDEFKNLDTRVESTLIAEASMTPMKTYYAGGTQGVVSKSNKKIPCYVLAFFDTDVVKKSLDFLTKYNDRLDIRVVENYSLFTESDIKPYILDLLKQGKISSYYLFDDNIGINAIEIVTRINAESLIKSEYFMITDGDLIIQNDEGWLDELVGILDDNNDVFSASLDLDLSNLPSEKIYPDVKSWIITPIEVENKNYSLAPTGLWFSLFRTEDYFKVLMAILNSGKKLQDSRLFAYSQELLRKKTARTKNNKAYHLTWDTYSDVNHPYTKWKMGISFEDAWEHNKYCNYTYVTKDETLYFTVTKSN